MVACFGMHPSVLCEEIRGRILQVSLGMIAQFVVSLCLGSGSHCCAHALAVTH